ncbi:hypothetical protein SAMN05444358_10464 [Ruegeria halocynthiae]|uniref:Uncharacterized protein n=1 Tax=Ruegeria halocynthiae TaxID=985054 RepID=A0A1H3A6W6_9RHOB|nr:hypothetical protein SAMN05444358_10464 [Ruegeria halocynthiae]
MKSQLIDQLNQVLGSDPKRFGKLVKHDGQNGFLEDAMQGLRDLDARIPTPALSPNQLNHSSDGLGNATRPISGFPLSPNKRKKSEATDEQGGACWEWYG